MRSLFLILLLAGSAHGLFGSLGQLVTNLWTGATGHVNSVIGNVVDSAGNVYGQLVSTANGIQFAANFLWDNVFGPAHGLLIEGRMNFPQLPKH